MKFYFIEPYNGGSHHYFVETISGLLKKKYQDATVEVISMAPRHWRLRFFASHLELAQKCNKLVSLSDNPIFIVNSLMDVAAFRSHLRADLRERPLITFFHENQMSYPSNPNSPGFEKTQSLQEHLYPLLHLNQILASDRVVFNSQFCQQDTGKKIQSWLKSRAEKIEIESFDEQMKSSLVIPIPGFEGASKALPYDRRPKKVVWNHRWEYDKNPEDFLRIISELFDESEAYQASLMGESQGAFRENFEIFQKKFGHRISAFGHQSRENYWKQLCESRLLLVTSFHDFLGLSVLEAMSCGVIPLLPRRMVYPELLPKSLHHQLLYHEDVSFDELKLRCLDLLEEGLKDSEWAAIAKYLKRFSADTIGEAWHALIETLPMT